MRGSHLTQLTCAVSWLDLSLQLQRDAGHLLATGVTGTPALGFLRGVTLEVDKGDQAVTAGLPAPCGGTVWHR